MFDNENISVGVNIGQIDTHTHGLDIHTGSCLIPAQQLTHYVSLCRRQNLNPTTMAFLLSAHKFLLSVTVFCLEVFILL